jgi:hypothetical protein
MGANEGEAHLISMLYGAAGQSEAFAEHGSRTILRYRSIIASSALVA